MPRKARTSEKYVLKLYVGKEQVSLQGIKLLKEALKGTDYSIMIIDIHKQPEEAEKDNVLVTPTLIKELPPPVKMIVGELVDKGMVLAGLDIVEEQEKCTTK